MSGIDITPAAVKSEASFWVDYLVQIIGVLCFTLGLAVLGTNNPPLYGVLSFIFVLLLHAANIKKAKILYYLQSRSKLAEVELLARDDYFRQIKLLNILPGIFGYVFLFIVAFGWKIFEKNPAILVIIYG